MLHFLALANQLEKEVTCSKTYIAFLFADAFLTLFEFRNAYGKWTVPNIIFLYLSSMEIPSSRKHKLNTGFKRRSYAVIC